MIIDVDKINEDISITKIMMRNNLDQMKELQDKIGRLLYKKYEVDVTSVNQNIYEIEGRATMLLQQSMKLKKLINKKLLIAKFKEIRNV